MTSTRDMLDQLREQDLKRKRAAGIKEVTVATCQDERVCDHCRALEGRRFKIGPKMPLPACDTCRCTYYPVIDASVLAGLRGA